MNSMSLNGAKKPVLRCDSAKREINNGKIMERGVTAVYRESGHALSTDSGESSGQNSVCNDYDYQTSIEDPRSSRHNANANRHQNSRDEIAEQLSKLKIGYNKNLRADSGTVDDMISEDDIQAHSIIAGYSPTDLMHPNSIQSIPDSRYSIILAGRLDSRDNLSSHMDEQSLLNTALNGSLETSGRNQSRNAELSRYVDSLEVQREEVSSSSINERDSLEKGTSRAFNDSGNLKACNILHENNENLDPNSLDLRRQSQPKIVSNNAFYPSVQISQRSGNKTSVIAARAESETSPSLSKNSIHSDQTENRFYSVITDAERQVFAGVKTPNVKAIHSVEICQQSTPMVGVLADTFGSDFLTDISRLSSLGVKTLDQDENAELDYSRDKIVRRYSEPFAENPTKFIEKLLALIEDSILHDSGSHIVNPDQTGVSLKNKTAEFRRKSCGKIIGDQSMPSLMMGSGQIFDLSNASALGGVNTTCEEPVSPFQNFSKLGGGRKVYRKTPRRVLNANGSIQCSTPNCANVLHKEKKGDFNSPSYCSFEGGNDSTASFVFWEQMLQESSPTKHTCKSISLQAKTPGSITQAEQKSDQQMALLEKSDTVDSATDEAGQRNLTTTSKDCQDYGYCTRQKFIENSLSSSLKNTDSNQKCNYHEMEQILTAGLVKKRRKCFEEAKKVFENKESVAGTMGGKSLDKRPEFMNENHTSREQDHQAVLIRTLSACADYIDHLRTVQYHRNSMLQCILECSEDTESLKENTNNSNLLEYVETVILPAQNRTRYRIEKAEQSPKNVKLVAETGLYLPGTPGSSCGKSLSKSPKARSHLSPVRSHLSPVRSHLSPVRSHLSPVRSRSPGRQSSSVLSKKIRSPVSPAKRKVIRAAKPASHACVPRTPSITPEIRVSKNKQISLSAKSGVKSTPRLQSNSKLKPVANSPGLMDVTNIKKRCEVPKLTITNASPLRDSKKKTGCLRITDENGDVDCQRKLFCSETDTPEYKETKYFFTPGNTPTYGKVRQKKKYFETPKAVQMQGKLTPHSPGSYRINYNTVQSPVALYIRGTDPNLITNVRGKTNERMLTPRTKTPKSKSRVPSPILARSPCMSPKSTESAGLKFQLTPARRQKQMQESDILNIALCESDPSSMIGSESTSHSPFPKIFYKPAQSVKMVRDNQPQRRCPQVLVRGTEEKMIYRHEGRLNSATKSKVPNFQTDGSSKDSMSCDSGDISLLHQRPAMKSNYLFKK